MSPSLLTLSAGCLAVLAFGCQGPTKECPPASPTGSAQPAGPSAPAQPLPAAKTPDSAEAGPARPAGTASSPAAPASPLLAGNQVNSPASLEEINRWATDAGVREDLLDWVAAGLSTRNTQTEVAIEYVGAENPVTAVVTVTLDRYLDDSVRGEKFLLKFSRKECSTCPSGMSGWWLWNMEVTRRCYKGRGHETFSKEPCR